MLKNKKKIGKTINSELNKENVLRMVMTYSEILQISHYPKIWAERLNPIDGESISSWITRISLANLEKTSSLTGDVGQYPSNVDLDLNWIPELALYFSKKTEIPELTLVKMSLYKLKENIINITKSYNSASLVKDLWFTGWRKRAKNGLRFCPLCLKNDEIPHFHKVWRLAYIPICIIHNCFLVNECPKCNSPIAPYELKWDSNLIKCFNCGYDLSKIKPDLIPNSDSLLKYFNDLNNEKTESIYRILTLAWFIANHCSFSDEIFEDHLLTKSKLIQQIENENIDNSNKKSYFPSIIACYLIIGTAIKTYYNNNLLNTFLHKYYSSLETFWTDTPFNCPQKDCNFTEKSYARMLIHIKRHNNERTFNCKKCGEKFVTKWDFETHIKLHSKPHPFKCPVKECDKEFRNEKHYIQHLRQEQNIKPYTCNICNKRFDRKYNLKTHIRIHTGEKPYKCEECGKQFAQKSELNVHLRTHTGKKPYICDICGKAFTQSHSLTEHIRKHTDERPYACPKCEKRYKRKHHLDIHIRSVHTREKPFKCEKCGKGFSDKGNMKKHMVSHSDERKYKCDVCGKCYKYSNGLSKHKKIEHTIKN